MYLTKIMPMVLTVVIVSLVGDLSRAAGNPEDIRPLPSVLQDIEKHIAELTSNLEPIKKRVEFLHSLPPTHNPVIQELRDLDLKGWELHLEQWRLQLDHLRFTKSLLEKARSGGNEDQSLKTEWRVHESGYRDNLETYRQKRNAIEEARLVTEGRMFERYLP